MPYSRFFSWRLWASINLLVIARIVWFDAAILFAPSSFRIQYIPDDAFYYLQLAKNFSRFFTWTFDSGVSVTSGFHLVNAYALSVLYALFRPDANEFVNLGLVWSSGLSITVVLLAWGIGWRMKSTLYFLILLWFTNTKNFTLNSVSITEWSLVLLAGILYALALYKYQKDARPRVALLLFALGIFGSLARSDFGLFPLGLFLGSAIISTLQRERVALPQSFIGLLGATLGVGIVFLHNYFFTGEWVQSSALMKAYWAQLYPIPFIATISLPPHLLGFNIEGAAEQIAFCFFVGATVLYLMLRQLRAKQNARQVSANAFALGSLIAFGGYLVFYSNNAAVQPWYTGTMLVPAFIVIFFLAKDVNVNLGTRTAARAILILAVAALIGFNLYDTGFVDANHAPWVWQQDMYQAGQALSQMKLDRRIGAWNAGILGYFQGGTLVNLDGLVNNDVYAYAIRNALPEYMAQKNIGYVIDYENLFDAPYMRQRGGYNDTAFLKRLEPVQTFDDGSKGYGRLILYRLKP